MRTHPLASAFASAVADRDLQRLGAQLTDTVRLRALLPADAIEECGREAVLAKFDNWFGSYETVVLDDAAGDDVGDKVLVHYKLVLDRDGERRVLTQTAVCLLDGGLVRRIDLVCSGMREF